jgi:transcription-repair coupling factor (superfamily II helicase)
LVEFVHAQNGQAKVKDNKIVVLQDWAKERDKIQGAFNIARELAQKLADEKKKKAG